MQITDSIYTANMNDHQRAWFYAEYERARKDEVVGVLLALFLGGIGIHHFYLRNNTAGIIYLLFFWTGIPMVISWFECFFMPNRVRQYNVAQAISISSQIPPATAPSNPQQPTAPTAEQPSLTPPSPLNQPRIKPTNNRAAKRAPHREPFSFTFLDHLESHQSVAALIRLTHVSQQHRIQR